MRALAALGLVFIAATRLPSGLFLRGLIEGIGEIQFETVEDCRLHRARSQLIKTLQITSNQTETAQGR
jgi:hypothetical protein